MEIQEYANQLKEYYESLMRYFSCEESKSIKESKLFEDIFRCHDFSQEKEELESILMIISKISENHCKSHNFIQKVEKILLHYLPKIKQTFTNSRIFEIFEKNKLILLFLFENKIINADEIILKYINEKSFEISMINYEEEEDDYFETENVRSRYNYNIYFYPEIKHLLNENDSAIIEKKKNEITNNNLELFYKNRKIGENDSYVCELIRNDSIEDFISYVNRNNISLSSKIKSSVFETSIYLMINEQSLIEYAVHWGSIQIFQYLRLNQVEMSKYLWLNAIYSNNGEIIHLLEEDHIDFSDEEYQIECLNMSIRCHHNEIAHYIIDNLINQDVLQNNIDNNFENSFCSCIFKYRNFEFLTDYLNHKFAFHFLCYHGYYNLVKVYLKHGKVNINEPLILESFFKSN